VAQDAHALGRGPALHLDDHLALKPHEPRMRQIERKGDSRRAVGAEPFLGDPSMRPHAQPALLELVVQIREPALQPRAFEREPQVLEPQLQQFLVGQPGPGKPMRHGAAGCGRSSSFRRGSVLLTAYGQAYNISSTGTESEPPMRTAMLIVAGIVGVLVLAL